MHRINLVIPCYNEEAKIGSVLESFLRVAFIDRIIVVDDGSTDSSASIVSRYPVTLLRNRINKGAGYSIVRGLRYSYDLANTTYTAIADADGQHTVEDLVALCHNISENKELIVYAYRQCDRFTPISKRIGGIFARLAMILLYGVYIKDPYCGLRIFSNELIPFMSFRDRFEWCADCSVLIQRNIANARGVPVVAHYSDYSLSKGLTLKQGLTLFIKLLKSRITYYDNQNTRRYPPLISYDRRS